MYKIIMYWVICVKCRYILYDKMSNIIDSSIVSVIDSICFSGGGYNCTYHLGIAKYIFENIETFKSNSKFQLLF